jgi:hypothetical protein
MSETFQAELSDYLDGMIPLPAHWTPLQQAEAKRIGRANRDAQRRHELAGFISGMKMVSGVSAAIDAMDATDAMEGGE